VFLESDGKEADARVVAARLERTLLGQVAKRIKIVTKPLVGKMGAFVQARPAGLGARAPPAGRARSHGRLSALFTGPYSAYAALAAA